MALAIRRRPGESVHIGADVTVKVVRIIGQQVHLAFYAPSGVRILREELLVVDGAGRGACGDEEPEE